MRIVPDRDRYRKWYVEEGLVHTLHNGDTVIIAKGYRFDGHSVPWPVRWLLPKYNERDIIAALLHDYLVDTAPWHRYNRRFIDKEYTTLMRRHSSGIRRFCMPKAVWLYGFLLFTLWNDDRGEPKPNTRIEVRVTHD